MMLSSTIFVWSTRWMDGW